MERMVQYIKKNSEIDTISGNFDRITIDRNRTTIKFKKHIPM